MKNGIARSPLFYVGDKYKLVNEIKTHLPDSIKRFIEPFVGGGSVFMNMEAERFLLNDIDANVISIHRMLCGYKGRQDAFFKDLFALIDRYGLSLSFVENPVPVELKQAYPKTYFAKYNKEAYSILKKDYNDSDRSDALWLYVLLVYGFNRMLRFNKRGDFNLPVGDVDFNKNTYDALEDYFDAVARKHIEWSCKDFRDFLGGIEYEEGDFVYLDPPYLITFSEYNKLWDEETEMSLLALLDDLNGENVKFAVSNVTHYKGKTNEVFLDWSRKYNTHPIKSNYISFNDNSIKKFNEVLITNY